MKNKPSLADIEAFNRSRDRELVQEPVMLEEDVGFPEVRESGEADSGLIETIRMQKSIIDRLGSKLNDALEQVKSLNRALGEKDREVARLKIKLEDALKSGNDQTAMPRQADQTYNRELILKNIVTLIEEKGFSYNDVARLFKLEGFLPPSPFDNWSDKVVEELYAVAR